MTPKGDLSNGLDADQVDIRLYLKEELCGIDKRLHAMVEAYEEKPSSIDDGVLNGTDEAVSVEAIITRIYRLMKTGVYSEDSPLRADNDIWEAFNEQKDEFIDFYKCALRALEAYKEVLHIYSLINDEAKRRPQHGYLERIRRDKLVHVEEREKCIDAVSHFHGKFSAMLTIL